MKTGSFLDMDMTSLGRVLREGLQWWLNELAAMVPARWQKMRGQPLIGATVCREADGSLSEEGEPLLLSSETGRPATLILHPDQILIRDVALPALGLADLRKLVALDLDRLMPFAAGTAYADVATDGTRGGDGKTVTRVAAVAKEDIRDLHEAALAHGLAPRAMGLLGADGKTLSFDFMPAFIADGGAPPRNRATLWWAVVAALFILNIGVMVWKDMRSVSEIQALVDAQQPLVTAARKLGQRLTNEDKLRAELMAIRRRDDAVAALALVTRIVPAGAWVQRYSWDGEGLRISGYKQPQVDVLAGLRKSGAFSSVRSTTSDVASESVTGQPFDITGEWAAR